MFHYMTSPRNSQDTANTMTTTTSTSSTSNPSSPPARFTRHNSRGEQTVAYADLMKPDEDWRNLPNAAERRKIQNRLAQRAYRRSLRERNEEIKRLRKKVEELEENQAQQHNELATPPAEPDPSPAPSLANMVPTTFPDTVPSAASVISASDWMGDYLNVWPHTPLSDHGSIASSAHNPMDTFTDFSTMDSVTDPMLQSLPEPGLDQTGTTETVIPSAIGSPFPQFMKCASPSSSSTTSSNGGSSSTVSSTSSAATTVGGHDMFAFQPMGLGIAQPGMGTGDLGCGHRQASHPGTAARLTLCGNKPHDACRYPSPPPSHCCCPSPREQDRPRCVVQPLDMNSLFMQGLVVEPAEGGDGVTIRLKPSVGDGRATVVAFMIQSDGVVVNNTTSNTTTTASNTNNTL